MLASYSATSCQVRTGLLGHSLYYSSLETLVEDGIYSLSSPPVTDSLLVGQLVDWLIRFVCYPSCLEATLGSLQTLNSDKTLNNKMHNNNLQLISCGGREQDVHGRVGGMKSPMSCMLVGPQANWQSQVFRPLGRLGRWMRILVYFWTCD